VKCISDFISGFSGDGFIRKATNAPGLSLTATVDPKVALYLENFDSWDYDVLALEQVTCQK